jgi:hypothetical protein
MSDFPECPCENPVAWWPDRQLRWIPRVLLAMTLFFLDIAFIHPLGPRYAVVATVAAIVFGPSWLFIWWSCRRESRRRKEATKKLARAQTQAKSPESE